LADAARKAGLADRRDIRLRLQAQADAMLAESYIRDQVTKEVTEEAIEAAYQERLVNAPPTQERHASHILVETEDEAKALKKQLDEGADFAELAAEHGTDGTAQRGGDLGWFGEADMVPEFADATFAMEPGQLSDPVQSSFGWHLIKLHDTRDAVVPPIEEVYSQLLTQLAEEAQRNVVEQAVEGAQIVKSEPQVPGDAIKNDALLEPSE
ncbi:MAG: peptidylprolyl isomerase, partial [Pseudomonadota bacterium]